MSFSIQRTEIVRRVLQVRVLLNFIGQNESQDVPPEDREEIKIVRGLFWVHLYGAFEKSVNDVVEQYRLAINNLNVKRADLNLEFYPVALDPWLTALRSSGKIKKRIDLVKAACAQDSCEISGSVFSDQLQNVWAKTLVEVAESLGASALYLRESRDEVYLDEVVDKRNGMAHGRMDPVAVGSVGRSNDLVVRFEAVNRLLEAFIQMLEVHANSMLYIKQPVRSTYSF